MGSPGMKVPPALMGIPGGEDVLRTEVWRLKASGGPQQCSISLATTDCGVKSLAQRGGS